MKRWWVVLVLLTATAAPARAEDDEAELRFGEGETHKRAFLGVGLLELTPQLRQHFGAPKEAGVLVSSVDDSSPAATGGLKVADVITAIDGHAVDDPTDLREQVRGHKPGEMVRLELLRERKKQTVQVTLAEREVKELDVFKLKGAGMKHASEAVRKALERYRVLQGRLPRVEQDLEERMKGLDERMQKLEKQLEHH
jgi:C-terminal processing protease CtpA/Prc